MRIAVIGAGGMGGYFGGRLARAGEDVIFLARGASLAALASLGLSVRSRPGDEFTLPVEATDDPDNLFRQALEAARKIGHRDELAGWRERELLPGTLNSAADILSLQ